MILDFWRYTRAQRPRVLRENRRVEHIIRLGSNGGHWIEANRCFEEERRLRQPGYTCKRGFDNTEEIIHFNQGARVDRLCGKEAKQEARCHHKMYEPLVICREAIAALACLN